MPDRVQKRIAGNDEGESHFSVSVVCTTYNHERYIRKALDGFLSQQTDFPFEIVIHDDASTDSTRSIIEQYAAEHPSVIKPILQEVNQYSQGGFKPLVYAARQSAGKYLALCEGDDYWIDNTKLQQQYDVLQAEPNIDFCFHSAYHLHNDVLDKMPSWEYSGQRRLHTKDILERSDGTFAPTSSYMVRREALDLLPQWFFERAPVGDFFIEMYGARRGGALYLDSPMSVYRIMSSGSWHVNTYGNDEAFGKFMRSMIEAINLMEPDFPGLADSFMWKRAWLYTFGAFHYLRRDNFEDFRRLIEQSRAETAFISKKQAIAYYLRRWPGIANQVLALLFHARQIASKYLTK